MLINSRPIIKFTSGEDYVGIILFGVWPRGANTLTLEYKGVYYGLRAYLRSYIEPYTRTSVGDHIC